MASTNPEEIMAGVAEELQASAVSAANQGFSTFSKQAIDEAQKHVEQYGMGSLKSYMEGKLDEWKHVKVRLAITGQSGAGKSSFINTMRNLRPGVKGAAKVGVTETTSEPTCYAHPDNENIELWDLPGVGTPNFPQSTYLQKVGFETYDCFIILSESRFTENDQWLASSVLKGGKRFYFLRTKIDNALRDDKEDKGDEFNEIATMAAMHKDCETNLAKIGNTGERMKVYLVTNRDSMKYDFPKLLKHVLEELPDIKREVMVRALSLTSKEMVLKKKEVLMDNLWWVAALSALGGVVPIPGVSIALDWAILDNAAKDQKKVLGIDENSLTTVAEKNGMTLETLMKSLEIDTSLMNNPVTWIKQMITSGSAMAVGSATEEVAKYIPIFGSLIAGGLSAATTYYIVGQMLDKHVDVAIRCLEVIAERAAMELD